MRSIYPLQHEPPLELLGRCGGYYECPKDAHEKRLGPLVGYAGRYDDVRQWVGDIYANFAKLERHSAALRSVTEQLIVKLLCDGLKGGPYLSTETTGFCGAPEGGKALAGQLADHCRDREAKQYIFPEKKVVKAKTETSREISDLVFDRHEPGPGEHWWIVEDVCNNFSTTEKLVTLIQRSGAVVDGIVCFLNRSLAVDDEYTTDSGLVIPVVSLVRKQIMEYRQDDPAVADDIAAGNVVWKPKNDWSRLEAAMNR